MPGPVWVLPKIGHSVDRKRAAKSQMMATRMEVPWTPRSDGNEAIPKRTSLGSYRVSTVDYCAGGSLLTSIFLVGRIATRYCGIFGYGRLALDKNLLCSFPGSMECRLGIDVRGAVDDSPSPRQWIMIPIKSALMLWALHFILRDIWKPSTKGV
jgi:hypothetical protein